jgi:hypothetical protein
VVPGRCGAGLAISEQPHHLWISFRRIEANATEISIRTYRNGLILKDKSFPRREVSDIRASVSGSSNSTNMNPNCGF